MVDIKAVLTLLIVIPSLISIAFWSANYVANPSPSGIENGAKLVADSATPWWVGVIQWLSGLPGIISAFLIVGLIFLLRYLGEI